MSALVMHSLPGLSLPAISHCGVCGRTLTDPVSIAAGIGPVCAHKHGHDDGFEQAASLDQFDPDTMDITCRRDARQNPIFNIAQRHKHHSPTGMEFGYAGSGPADFALNILALFLPVASDAQTWKEVWPWEGRQKVTCGDGSYVSGPAWTLHQDFKFAFIATLPREGGVIPGDTIRQWIASQPLAAQYAESEAQS